ncbi:vgr related protein [Erythrobacter sp. SG61-1L]|nr:vgr related protein [Erythrobacter sp. SG61-1L]
MTPGEITLARSIFGNAIDYAPVRIRRRKWFPFQPRKTVMAPRGHLHFHPDGPAYCDDFAKASLGAQGLFIHEMAHVWQHQSGMFLPFRRLPLSRYAYALRPGWPLHRYGIEQQAEIVRHAFLLRNGASLPGATDAKAYEALVDFPGAKP